MDNSNISTRIEELLYTVDFSHGRKQGIWEKIIPRLDSGDELSFDELGDVAGGTSRSPELDGGTENKWRK